MESESPGSAFDELMRLSQETTKKEQDFAKREQQRSEQKQKAQGVLQGLKQINVSLALQQLEPIATPEIIKEISSLTHKPGTGDLRKIISGLADDLERQICSASSSNPDTAPLERPIKTLTILIDLFFSLQ